MKVSQQAISQAKQQWEICKAYQPSIWFIDLLDSDNLEEQFYAVEQIAKLYTTIKQIPTNVDTRYCKQLHNETAYLRYISYVDGSELLVTRSADVSYDPQAQMNILKIENGTPRFTAFNAMFLNNYKMDMDFEPKAI